MRRFVFGAVLVLTLLVAAPASAASALSWRATITGDLSGGATVLIDSTARGTFSVSVAGAAAGTAVIAEIVPAACGKAARAIVAFRTAQASAAGNAIGATTLNASQVARIRAGLSARTAFSVHVVNGTGAGAMRGCGALVGAPGVGTARLTGTVAAVGATYDIRYPVLSGLDVAVATAINDRLSADARATVAGFITEATQDGPPMNDAGASAATQTFSVSLSRSNLLSLGELESTYATGAAHPLDFLSTSTFDLLTGRRLALADLFRPGTPWLQTLSTESRARLKAVPGLELDFRDGTAPKAINFQSWQLTTAGLKITFGEYQVAPFAFGMPVVVIPWARLRPIMDLGGPVGRLVPAGPCQAGQLTGQMSDWDAGLGSRFDTVTLTNQSTSSCWLQGTPQSELFDSTGRILLNSATAGASGLPHVSPGDPRVTIAPGARGRIDVRASNYCGTAAVGSVRIALILPSGGGRAVAAVPPGGSTGADLPPCNGPTLPGRIETNGWHHA